MAGGRLPKYRFVLVGVSYGLEVVVVVIIFVVVVVVDDDDDGDELDSTEFV